MILVSLLLVVLIIIRVDVDAVHVGVNMHLCNKCYYCCWCCVWFRWGAGTLMYQLIHGLLTQPQQLFVFDRVLRMTWSLLGSVRARWKKTLRCGEGVNVHVFLLEIVRNSNCVWCESVNLLLRIS